MHTAILKVEHIRQLSKSRPMNKPNKGIDAEPSMLPSQSLNWKSSANSLEQNSTLCMSAFLTKMAYMLSVWKLASRRRMRAVKHQKASASLRMTYRMGDARSDMPCTIFSKSTRCLHVTTWYVHCVKSSLQFGDAFLLYIHTCDDLHAR